MLHTVVQLEAVDIRHLNVKKQQINLFLCQEISCFNGVCEKALHLQEGDLTGILL